MNHITFRLWLAIILTVTASLIGGIFMVVPRSYVDKLKHLLLYIGTGILLGTIFLHALPELMEQSTYPPPYISGLMLLGVLIAFVLEKISCWHHCHLPQHQHSTSKQVNKHKEATRPRINKGLILTNLLGDSLHNILHGFVLYNAYKVSDTLGVSILAGILGHEIPGELADMSILLYAGLSVPKALAINLLVSLTTLFGTLLVFIPVSSVSILAVGVGILLYIALTDLLTELKQHNTTPMGSITQISLILLGLLSIWLL